MYKAMFYGGIAGTVLGIIFTIYIFNKKKVRRSIKDLICFRSLWIAMLVGGVFVIKPCIDSFAMEQEKTTVPIISEIQYTYADEEKLTDKAGVIYCNKEVLLEFCVEDNGLGIGESEDGMDNVYVKMSIATPVLAQGDIMQKKHGDDSRHEKINDSGLLYYAASVPDKKGTYCVSLFGDEGPVIEDGYFDGTIDVFAEDKAGSTGSVSAGRIIYYEGYPKVSVGTVFEDDEMFIGRKNEEAENEIDPLWTSKDLEMTLNTEDKVGISKISYIVGDNEPIINTYEDEEKMEDFIEFVVSESAKNSEGIKVSVNVENNCGNTTTEELTVYMDKELPLINDVIYDNSRKDIFEQEGNIYSDQSIRMTFSLIDIASGVDETSVKILLDDGRTIIPSKNKMGLYYADITGKDDDYYDGSVSLYAVDNTGNVCMVQSKRLVCYSGKPTLDITAFGVTGKWTKDDVIFHIKALDDVVGIKQVLCVIDGKKVKDFDIKKGEKSCEFEYVFDKKAKDKNGHKVEITSVNMCGVFSTKSYKIYIDKDAPTLSLSGVEQGEYYSKDVSIDVGVADVSYSAAKVNYRVSRLKDGITYKEKIGVFIPRESVDKDTLHFEHEGEYILYVEAIDGAGNKTVMDRVIFVIDKTAPVLSVEGVENESVNARAVNLIFNCMESFYATNDITVHVDYYYGQQRKSYNITPFVHDRADETVTQNFKKDGVYHVSIFATDKAGNKAEEKRIRFSIDCTAPIIKIAGTKSHEQWANPVEIDFTVKEFNYKSNKVSLSGKRTDIDGTVHELKLPDFKNTGNVSSMRRFFEEDGIYDISIACKDKAGNVANKNINFLIDTKEPEIRGIEDFDGGYFKEFSLADVVEKMFKDLTLSSFRILLNGMDYDGTGSIVYEGKYNLYVEAVDELGHKSYKNARFIVDNTAPKVMFFGALDGAKVFERGVITWKLDDENDKITKIFVNGEEISADMSELSYNECGKYNIEIESIDRAGNEGHSKLSFEYVTPDKNIRGAEKMDIVGYFPKDDKDYKGKNAIVYAAVVTVMLSALGAAFIIKTGRGRK